MFSWWVLNCGRIDVEAIITGCIKQKCNATGTWCAEGLGKILAKMGPSTWKEHRIRKPKGWIPDRTGFPENSCVILSGIWLFPYFLCKAAPSKFKLPLQTAAEPPESSDMHSEEPAVDTAALSQLSALHCFTPQKKSEVAYSGPLCRLSWLLQQCWSIQQQALLFSTKSLSVCKCFPFSSLSPTDDVHTSMMWRSVHRRLLYGGHPVSS